MKITFIRPNIGRLPNGPYLDEGRMEPLPLGILAALTPPDVECALYDDRVEEIPFDEPTDLAAITAEIYTARRAYEISAEYRKRGVPVILGGFHPTLAPEECLEHADSVFRGEAEPLWAQVVEDARHRRLRPVYHARAGTPQPEGLRPRRDLFRGKQYLPITLMQFGRGCRFHCTFCAISAYFEGGHGTRPVREVLAEIESQDRRLIFFVDDNFVCDRAAAKRFLRELIPMRVRWVSQGAIDMTEDPELMDLMEASGCLGHVIGFESISPESLRGMAKRPNLGIGSWDRYEAACGVLRRHHLQTWAAFTLGHDDDTPESIRETLEFALRQKFAFAAFNILMPYPGTPLHERLGAEGRLLYDGKWWLHPDYRFNHAAFVPSRMSPDELTAAGLECRERWNRAGSILRRIWDFSTHLSSPGRAAIYLNYTRLYARETLRKQGMLLGLFRDAARAGAPVRRPEADPKPGADCN
jgi:radical SAM superfamily enzyme YgiQ (UPF0313 family)